MSKNINRAVSLTSYLIELPMARYLVIGMLLFGIIFGLILDFSKESGQSLVSHAIIDGFLLLVVPALLTSIVVKLLMRSTPYRRIAAIVLAGEIVYGIAYLVSAFVFDISPLWAQVVLLFGAALVFILWYVIARFVFLLKYRSVLFAIIQLLFYLVFLLGTHAVFFSNEPVLASALRFYLSSFVLFAALILFFLIINAPMKKNLGVSSTDAMSYFFSQWLYHNKDMEKAFESVGENAKTIVSIMAFKRQNDTVFFLTPYIHYGPFGNLGGSEFSYLIAQSMDNKYHDSKTFVFHGTVTHDLNPVSSSEISKILSAVDSSFSNATFNPAKISVSFGSNGDSKVHALKINNSAFVSLTRAPELTEDVNFGLGLSIMMSSEKYVSNAMIVDQHNAETGEITSFEPGSEIGYQYLKSVDDAFLRFSSSCAPLKVGVALVQTTSLLVGKAGIKVAVLSSSPEYVLVLIDSNGITPEFRSHIEQEIISLGIQLNRKFTVGIYTTDTHQVNVVRGVINPLRDEKAFLDEILAAVKTAAADMQDATYFCDKKWFNIDVIGAKQSIELISTVNSIVAVSKIVLPLILLGGLAVILALLTKL